MRALVADTGISCTRSPKTASSALYSAMSPTGVLVACALMCVTSSTRRAGLLERREDGARGAAALGVGRGDVVRVARDAAAGDLGVDLRAAGVRVLLGLEDERGRALAHDEAVAVDVVGAGAVAGSSLRFESACIDANEASVIGWIAATRCRRR